MTLRLLSSVTARPSRAIIGEMDRDGYTVVPEANAPIVTALAGEPAVEPTVEPAAAQRGEQLWVFVYIGTTPIGSVIDGAITKAGGTRATLLTGAAACLVAAGIASLVRTPPHPDAALTDIAPR
jgi:hypothetical protein